MILNRTTQKCIVHDEFSLNHLYWHLKVVWYSLIKMILNISNQMIHIYIYILYYTYYYYAIIDSRYIHKYYNTYLPIIPYNIHINIYKYLYIPHIYIYMYKLDNQHIQKQRKPQRSPRKTRWEAPSLGLGMKPGIPGRLSRSAWSHLMVDMDLIYLLNIGLCTKVISINITNWCLYIYIHMYMKKINGWIL